MAVKFTAKQQEAFSALGLNNLEDILMYFPYRYEILKYIDFSDWKENSNVAFEATVISKPKINFYKGRNCVIYFDVSTDYDDYRISVFNRSWLVKQLPLGEKITIIGKYQGNSKVLANQILKQDLNSLLGIHPVYSLKDKIRENTFNKKMDEVLLEYHDKLTNFVPSYYLDKYNYENKYNAIYNIHRPLNEDILVNSLNTLKYEEFLKFNLLMQSRRDTNFKKDDNFAKKFEIDDVYSFIDKLPFRLTDDQLKAVNEILADMKENKQMTRLLQGDVGCGKTIVSFIAMYAAFLANKQAALLAPTEILTKQHYDNICKIFKDYPIKIGVLYSSQTSQQRKEVLSGLASGEISFVVGTHSLFQKDVDYHNLGLVITDEQHRFGVKQRAALVTKGNYTDILLMSATPIPRTLATTLYGDIDVSTITQTPNAKKKITTKLIKKNSFIPVIKEIEELLATGNQMYVICPSIESETGRNVKDIFINLSKYFKGRYEVGLLHGQMSTEDKDKVEELFACGRIDILVATTVVEVGVDVKSANIMVIYDANKFGLSQLHQLRGRIGRGDNPGYCYLLTDNLEEDSLNKLDVIVKNTNGFDISYYDLKMRGPGDIMGFKQSGLPEFVLGNIIEDGKILNESRNDAIEILNNLDKYPYIEQYISQNNDNSIIYS